MVCLSIAQATGQVLSSDACLHNQAAMQCMASQHADLGLGLEGGVALQLQLVLQAGAVSLARLQLLLQLLLPPAVACCLRL